MSIASSLLHIDGIGGGSRRESEILLYVITAATTELMIRNKFVCSPTLRSQCIHSFIHSFNKPKRLVAEHALLMLVH